MKRVSRQLAAFGSSAVGANLVALTLVILLLFAIVDRSYSQLPISTGAPYVRQKVADFTLPDQAGKLIALHDLLKPQVSGKSNGLVLIFYRGYW